MLYKIIIFSLFIPGILNAQDNYLAYTSGSFCNNYINISGKSNVNRFEFRMDFPSQEIFLINHSNITAYSDKKIYEIPIPVKDFKASSKILYQDFLTLLNANLHPRIIIGIGSEQLRNFLKSDLFTYQLIEITLSGITKQYMVSCIVSSCSDNLIYVSGYKNLRLTDFNIDPPEKFQGLVKVKDEVMINFGFVFSYKD